jgi:hypothetical protein
VAPVASDHQAGTGPRNPDDEEAKRDRQMIELLNELRVALPGVQILFAFLLAVPFAQGWERTTAFQKDVFFVTLVATAVSTICLIAPSSWHRIRFHQNDRAWLIESANKIIIAGLVALAVAINAAVLLITDVLFDGTRVWIYAGLIAALMVALWFLLPLSRAIRGDSSGP